MAKALRDDHRRANELEQNYTSSAEWFEAKRLRERNIERAKSIARPADYGEIEAGRDGNQGRSPGGESPGSNSILAVSTLFFQRGPAPKSYRPPRGYPPRSKPNSITCARSTLIRHRIPTVAR